MEEKCVQESDVKISDIRNAARENNFENMQLMFDIMTEKESGKQKIGLCRHLFCRIPYDNYTILVRLILKKIPKKKIKSVFIQQEDEVVRALQTKVDYQEVAQELKSKNELDKLGTMLDAIDLTEIDELITIMPLPELLLELGTKRFAQRYINEYLGESPDDMLSFLKINSNVLPLDLAYNLYIDIIIKYLDMREEAAKRLIDFLKQNINEKKKTLSYKEIIKLVLGLQDEQFPIVDNIVQLGTKYAYDSLPMKSYAQTDADTEKSLQPFRELLDKKIPAKHIIYVYMNTKLRESVLLNALMEEMILIGYSEAEVVNAVRDYWIAGCIKYVTEDGIVRVSADSISTSRLMTFNANMIHISGENGEWITPEKGQKIYYKIRNYLSGGKFYIHYPCKKKEYISNNSLQLHKW